MNNKKISTKVYTAACHTPTGSFLSCQCTWAMFFRLM